MPVTPETLCSSSSKFSVEKFESVVQFKSLRALADPGEAVGLLAAQVRDTKWGEKLFNAV